ncbi:hypothetical protein F511_44561 [Dorcoceras hygrometricum]|uniref:Uncharacterized protein n=1 Tax=Dorcoceras hygrometricum TaxID=472368 RepID=A0A2Z7ACH5_9LAMI|nr:hypothetical protein F511_44561 [Dorcoceras hygrometricum]
MCGGDHHVARVLWRALVARWTLSRRALAARQEQGGRTIALWLAAGLRTSPPLVVACWPAARARSSRERRRLAAQIAPPVVALLHSMLRAMAGCRGAAGRRLLGAGCTTMRAGRAMGERRCARPRVALGVESCGCRRVIFRVGGRRSVDVETGVFSRFWFGPVPGSP